MWNILLGIDGSEPARHAVDVLRQLHLPAGSRIQVSTVVSPRMERRLEAAHVDAYEAFAGLVARTSDALRREGVEVAGTVLEGPPAHALVEEASALGANLVVVGSRGLSGVPRLLLGSVARNVAHHAPCSVLVARSIRHSLGNLVLGTDGSTDAAKAVDLTLNLPLPASAHLTVATVLRPPTAVAELPMYETPLVCGNFESERLAADALTGSVCAYLAEAGREAAAEVRIGDPAHELVALAEERHADLILVGARGLSLIERLVVGSVADHVVKFASCSVLVAR